MEIGNRTAEKYLKKYNFSADYKNVLTLKDEVESDYDREDYSTLDDLMDDAINNLDSMGRLDHLMKIQNIRRL